MSCGSSVGDEGVKRIEEENRELRDKLLYMRAEIENMRKLMLKEVERAELKTSERILGKIIGIYEDIRRAVESLPKSGNPFALAEGLKLILKQMESLLDSEGVKRIETVGKQFDPFIHEAVDYVERDDVEDGTIVEEVEAGYSLADRILKSPKVKVAKKPKKTEETKDREA